MSNIKFTDTLEVTASHGRLAKAAQIYDDEQKATQAALNKKFLAYTPDTDFAHVFDEQAPDPAYVVDDLIENNVKAGRIIRNVNSAFFVLDENNNSTYYPVGSYFLVIKDPVKGDEINKVIRPIVASAYYTACAIKAQESIIKRLDALEARLKV